MATTLADSSLPAASSQIQTRPISQGNSSFSFPSYATFPPFYTLQPNLQTRARQLELWNNLVVTYCTYHRIYRLSLSSLPPGLFNNTSIQRSLKPADIRTVLDHMSKTENGGRVEWIAPATKSEQSNTCYVWWRMSGEWADLLHGWVEETAQKGTVLTIYELREGDAMRSRDWKDMDEGMLRKVLGVLVKRGKAQIFGQPGEGDGVKFF